jgi:acyl dehydratase
LQRIFLGEAQVGDEVEMRYQMTPELVDQYVRTTGDRNPWYTGPSPFGGPVAPPVLICMQHSMMLSEKFLSRGRMLISTDANYFGPVMVGTTIVSKGRIVANYVKRDRQYVDMEAESWSEDGRLLIKDRRSYLPKYSKGGGE